MAKRNTKKIKKGQALKTQGNRKKGASNKSNQKTQYILALIIAVFGFLLYANTLSHGYVLDDFSQIKENFITQQGIEGIGTQWTTHARYGYRPGAGELYRPIPMTMFSLEWEIAPDNPGFSHLINVLLYALTGALLFLTLARIMKQQTLLFPFLTCLFFMAHPVHVEVVANIKSRDEIVMFLMCILSLHFLWRHQENGQKKHLIYALLSYTIALFSKENAVTFLAIFPLFLYFFRDVKVGDLIKTTAPFVGLAIAFIFIRSQVIGAFGTPGSVSILDNFLVGATDSISRFSSSFLILGKYLWTLLLPHPLVSDAGFSQIPLTGLGDWRVLLSLLAYLGMGIFAILTLGKKNMWSFIILFFLINFSIFTNLIITIGTSFGERLLYSSSPAFAMALAYGLLHFFGEKAPDPRSTPSIASLFKPTVLWAFAGVLLCLYSFKTIDRNKDWVDSFSLYDTDILVSPNSAKLNFHYGLELVKKGNDATTPAEKQQWYGKAKTCFQKCISLAPEYHDAYGQLGLAFYRDKNYQEALKYYNLALKYRPHFPLVHSNMGTLYSETGDNVKAKEMYELAVKEDPRMVDALRNLGAINAMQGNFPEAIKWFAQGLKYDPNNPTLNRYLGSAYQDNGEPDKGKPYLDKAAKLEKQQ